MAAEPIVIYSHKVDPAGVLEALRRLAPDLAVEGPPDNWTRTTIKNPRGALRKASTLSFGHDRGYYAGPEWANQMRGMQGYFSRFPANENTARIMLLIDSFRFSITTFPPPEPELFLDSDDPRLRYVFAVVKHLDGVIFTPSSLRDAAGRVLYGARDPDPQAVMPAIYKTVAAAPRSARTRSQHGTLPDEGAPRPLGAERVARRACALAAVTGRASLERQDPHDSGVEQTRQRILRWVDEIGIGDELEPDEWKLLQLPLGAPPQHDTVNATWRLEGLGVLLWALGRYELPPHDEPANVAEMLPLLGVPDAAHSREFIQRAALRPAAELEKLRERLFAIHWRVTDWRLRPRTMDFANFAKTAWFGPLDLEGVSLAENDLAIGGLPISRAAASVVAAATSAAMERHLAINWLHAAGDRYSQTDVST